jgi:hypothetical protein
MAERSASVDRGHASARRLEGNGAGRKGGQMQKLLGEFKGLYEGKLKRLDEAERSGEDVNRVGCLLFISSCGDLFEGKRTSKVCPW